MKIIMGVIILSLVILSGCNSRIDNPELKQVYDRYVELEIFNEYVALHNKGVYCGQEYNKLVNKFNDLSIYSSDYKSTKTELSLKKQTCGKYYREARLYLQDNRKYIEPTLKERGETYYSEMADVETSISFYS